MEKAGNKRDEQMMRRFSFDERRSDRGIAQKEKEMQNDQDSRIECIEKNNDTNKVDERKDFTKAHQLRRHSCPTKARSVEVEGEQSSNAQRTTSLASMLAEEFKRDTAVDMHGGVLKHDDGGELFDRPGNIAHNKSTLSKATIANTELMADAAEKQVKGGKKRDRFKLSELSNSTSGTVKKQFHSFKEKSSTQGDYELMQLIRSSLLALPFRRRFKSKDTEATSRKPRGARRWKL